MNLRALWKMRFGRRTPAMAAMHGSLPVSASLDDAASASGLDALQARLNHWSHLWAMDGASAISVETQRLVTARLMQWMDRCFGKRAHRSLRGEGGQISLAASTPIFTAFLGRRATRELSRRVLKDI